MGFQTFTYPFNGSVFIFHIIEFYTLTLLYLNRSVFSVNHGTLKIMIQ